MHDVPASPKLQGVTAEAPSVPMPQPRVRFSPQPPRINPGYTTPPLTARVDFQGTSPSTTPVAAGDVRGHVRALFRFPSGSQVARYSAARLSRLVVVLGRALPAGSGAPEAVRLTGTSGQLMSSPSRRFVGAINLTVGIFAFVALVATYGLTEQLVVAQEAAADGEVATKSLPLFGADLPISLNMSLILVGAAAGVMGSAIQQSMIFALRAGYEQLERGYVWWYALRPMWSALLGALAVVAVNAGLVSIGDTTTSSAGVTVLVTAGALAGLFTDQVLQRLQQVLGATPPSQLATQTDVVKNRK